MNNASEHVVKVLEILLERSHAALRAFDEGDDDLALEALKGREIGFANLRAAEWIAESKGWSFSSDPGATELARAVIDLDAKLKPRTQTALDSASQDLKRVKRLRSKFNKYHSGSHEGARFEKSV